MGVNNLLTDEIPQKLRDKAKWLESRSFAVIDASELYVAAAYIESLRAELASRPAGAPQAIASRPQGEPVAFVARDDNGVTNLFLEKPYKRPCGDWVHYQTAIGLGHATLGVKEGECRGIILMEQITPPAPHRVEDLPGYAWHNDALSVFAANGRTATVIPDNTSKSYPWMTEFVGWNRSRNGCVNREAAERAASAWVTNGNGGAT